MRFDWKRICALLLTLALALSLLPGGFPIAQAAQTLTDDDYARADRVFEAIADMEAAPAKRNATQTQKTDAAIRIVEASDSYAEGSLERNGNAFFWWTEDGIRCMYNPRMQKLRENMKPENMVSQAVNEPKPTKGGSPAGKQVYLIGPYYGADENFGAQSRIEAREVAQAIGDTDGYTLYSGKAATIDKVAEAVSNGAVVFFDSHGATDYSKEIDRYNGIYDLITGATTSYLCLSTREGLTTQDYNDGASYGGGDVFVNGKVIANHMTKNSPNGFVWMALCLGMGTRGLFEPLRENGVEVVYGYSGEVTFLGDYLYEEVFWDEMKAGKTVAQSAAKMKEVWGDWDYSDKMFGSEGYGNIAEARKDFIAFPVVVSDEDEFPGQRTTSSYGADSVQTVRSTYTLGQVYPVTDPTDPKVILEEAYALYSDEQLPYEATLTGTVVKVVEAYNELYGNVTVNMKIPGYEDKPIRCNYLVGDGVDRIGAGDTITVKGFIVNNASGGVGFDRDCVLLSWEDGDIEIDIPLNPPADPIALKSMNINLASALTLNLNGLKSVLDQYENVYVIYQPEGGDPVKVTEYFESTAKDGTQRYNFAFPGLTITDINLNINYTIYGTFKGKEYSSDTKSVSLLKYCRGAMVDSNSANVACANLIKYAIAAEAFIKERDPETDDTNFLEKVLTAEDWDKVNQYAYADDELKVEKTSAVDQANATVQFRSQALNMLERITLLYKIQIPDGVDTGKLTFKVTYKNVYGNDDCKEYTFADLEYETKTGHYVLSFSEFYATQMREKAKCTIYLDGVEHASYTNSMENYCYTAINDPKLTEKEKYLARRISLYGDACEAAFTN